MQPTFEVQFAPAKIIFGDGTIDRTGEMIEALGCARALILSTPQQSDQAVTLG